MRVLLTLMMVSVLVQGAVAAEPGTAARIEKSGGISPARTTPGVSAASEDLGGAIAIAGLPFTDSRTTCDSTDDYHFDCGAAGANSPDVVYSFTPGSDGWVRVDLCGSLFDTKLLVVDEGGALLDCNDDAYLDSACGQYTSLIPGLEVTAGLTVLLVVDGYGGDCGQYDLSVEWVDPPTICSVSCVGSAEGEPPLADGYEDTFNGGCNSPGADFPFQDLLGDASGENFFCGRSGWYDGAARDTDWFVGIVGAGGLIEWVLDAEQRVQGRVLAPLDCTSAATLHEFTAGPCSQATLSFTAEPGSLVWLWIAPLEFVPPAGFTGHEFRYNYSVSGLQASTIATERTSWDHVKSMYR